MAMREGGRLRKRWRYVGVYGAELMLCVGAAEVGPLPQSWWAIWDRRQGALRERTALWRPGRVVRMGEGVVTVRDHDVEIDLHFTERLATAHETRLPHGDAGGWIWTRKQAPVAVHGTVKVDGAVIAVDALGLIDDTAGFHERETAWHWSAGIGREDGGAVVAWNLVTGVNDPPTGSERAVWRGGGPPAEVGPVTFAADLSSVRFAEGGELAFASEAIRERHDDLRLVASDYVQPFGTFSGTLPGGARLTEGFGVMEDHRARW